MLETTKLILNSIGIRVEASELEPQFQGGELCCITDKEPHPVWHITCASCPAPLDKFYCSWTWCEDCNKERFK